MLKPMKMSRLCDVCGSRPAIFYQIHSGRRLCKECFFNDVRDRVKKHLDKYGLLDSSDKILIGISGGKDSYTLFKILIEIHNPSKVIGLMINEGIRGYNREDQFNFVKNLCRDYGVDCIETSLKSELGYSVDDFMYLQLKSRERVSACTFCGIARRRILNMYARMYDADKVATGHNLDDEVQTYVINILRGDIMRLLQLHPLSEVHSSSLVKRIKPLRIIYEYESAFYAYLENYHFQEVECPYIHEMPTLRVRIREMLYTLEKAYPGLQLRFLEYWDNILEPYVKSAYRNVNLPRCIICGEPTSPKRTICKLCELISKLQSGSSSGSHSH